MTRTSWSAALCLGISLWVQGAVSTVCASDGSVLERGIPKPLADHPGNVFLDSEAVRVIVPPGIPRETRQWQALDDRGGVVRSDALPAEPSLLPSHLELGRLPAGWYRIEFLDEQGDCLQWTTAAVLKQLAAPTPPNSPICVDSATAWFAKDQPGDQRKLASLAALAGVNGVRDRLTWREVEPMEGAVTPARTTYDSAASIQASQGLQILQVFHSTPSWAWNQALDGDHPGGRFARDLRQVYRFCRVMAQRYRGRVQAWEPWNEANVSTFGGHTVDEMCSYQKAAYLGFKAGDPQVTVGWNVYTTVPTPRHTQGLLDNQAWSYFDTYNIHTYEWAHDYARLWGPARRAACGKPLWITEADRGIKYVGPEPWCELRPQDEMLKAQYMAQSYASSLYAGSVRHYHFILGHYHESHNHVQFGLLRKDMTPRPAYVALAAVGRLLAGARCLGRWPIGAQEDAHIMAFRAWPDGKESDVLVAWAEGKVDWALRGKTSIPWRLPNAWAPEAVYDYLGRRLGKMPQVLSGQAVLVVLPPGQLDEVKLTSTAGAPQRRDRVCPVVLQIQMPRAASMKVEPLPWSQGYEYRITPDPAHTLNLYAYNFSGKSAKGTIRVAHKPVAWTIDRDAWHLTVDPMQREPFRMQLTIPAGQEGTLGLAGDFGPAGQSAFAFRIGAK